MPKGIYGYAKFLFHCPFQGLPCADVKIKWPNDLYLNGLKIGGILCTSTYKSKKFNVSVGNGIVLLGNDMQFFCDLPCCYICNWTGWTVFLVIPRGWLKCKGLGLGVCYLQV